MDCSTPGLPVLHHLLELTQTHVHRVTDATQPSHPLSLFSPLGYTPTQHETFLKTDTDSSIRGDGHPYENNYGGNENQKGPWALSTSLGNISLHPAETAGFPGGLEGKASACSAEDPGSSPASERSPGEGNGNPLQCSCLENPMDEGAWSATVHGVTKIRTRLSDDTQERLKDEAESTGMTPQLFGTLCTNALLNCS